MYENIDHIDPVFDRNAQVTKFSQKFTDEKTPRKFRQALATGEIGVGKTSREA